VKGVEQAFQPAGCGRFWSVGRKKQEQGWTGELREERQEKRQAGKPAPQFYRRKLPHWQPDGAVLFLTWRLADSLPREAVERLRVERERLMVLPAHANESPREKALRVGKALFAKTDVALAEAVRSGVGPRWLGEARIAEVVRSSLYFWHGRRYLLHRYVIMPNHVHVLLEPAEVEQPFQAAEFAQAGKPAPHQQPGPLQSQAGKPAPQHQPQYQPLRVITQGLKGYIAREANRLLGRHGIFWQDEGFDHWIRDEERYQRCILYIDRNPVDAGLCGSSEAWRWGSAGESVG